MAILLMTGGVFMVVVGSMTQTSDLTSTLICKTIPIALGAAQIGAAVSGLGII